MAKLPDDTAFGEAPSAHSGRAVASYDVSGLGRGAAAIAEGIGDIGRGLSGAGANVAAVAQTQRSEDDQLDMAKAKSDYLSKKVALDAEFERDGDYATLQQRYDKRLAEIRAAAGGLIRNGRTREKFELDTEVTVAQGRARAGQWAWNGEASANRAWADQQGNVTIERAVRADPETRRQLIDAHNELIDSQVDKKYLTHEQGLAKKQTFVKQFVVTDMAARIDQDPEGVINELRSQPGTAEAITTRIIANEKGARADATNPKSSAMGDGQFIKETWLDIVRRRRPELAQGRSDDEILRLRADRSLSHEMTEAYRQENEAALKAAGLPATPGQQYLAHFFGPGTAAAVLKADPNLPIEDVLTQTLGEAKAKKIVAANRSVLDGKLTGTVTGWADKKMGGAAPGGGQIYDILPPDQRARLLHQAESVLAQRRATDTSMLKQRIEDTVSEARRTGTVVSRVSEDEFIGTFGAEAGSKAWREYEAELQSGADVRDVAGMDPATQAAMLARNEPQPGTEGYASQAKRHDALATAIAKVEKEKADDPAAFAISRLPVVQEAYQTFSAIANDPTALPAAKAAAARDLAMKMDMEQARIGIPAAQRTLMPKAYVDQLNERLSNPQKTGGTLNVASMIKQEAELWGDNWPTLYRELSKDAEPVVRVIGSGVTPMAAQLLVELKGQSAGEILKDQSEERLATLNATVREAFRPFARSLTGNEGASKIIHDFQGQALKLTAYWTAAGDTPETAAAKAYDQLVAHKYDFGPTWRVPKAAGVSSETVADGVAAAMRQLGHRPSGAPAGDFAGVVERGNIDLDNRPTVRIDGDIATVRSMSANIDGVEVLIPTIGDDGKILTEEQAIAQFEATGKHLGKFDTPANAEAYARSLSEQQGRRYASANPLDIAPARDNIGGLSDAYRQRETLRAIRRDGIWVTDPDETGLALIYKDQAVNRRDGSPVILTWQQLQEMGKRSPRPLTQSNERPFAPVRGVGDDFY